VATAQRKDAKAPGGYGSHFTTVKDRKKEIGPGLLRKMLRDLGLSGDDLN